MPRLLFCLLLVILHITTANCQEILYISADFEDGLFPAGWSQVTLATDGGYVVGNRAELSSGYVDFQEHGKFIATNDDKCNCDKSNEQLILPVVDLTNNFAPVFMYYDFYFSNGDYNGADEQAWIELSNDGQNWFSTELSTVYPSGTWNENVTVDLAPYNGGLLYIRFRYEDSGDWQYGFALDNIKVVQPAAINLACGNIEPYQNHTCQPEGNEQVRVNIINKAYLPASGFTASYTITYPDGTTNTISEAVDETIAPYESLEYTFNNANVLEPIGDYTLSVNISIPNDEQPEDDNQTIVFTHYSGELRISGTASPNSDQNWVLRDQDGNEISKGGRWIPNSYVDEITCLDDNNCYNLTFQSNLDTVLYDFVTNNPDLKIDYNKNTFYTPEVVLNSDYNLLVQPAFKIWRFGGGCPQKDIAISDLKAKETMIPNGINNVFKTLVTNKGVAEIDACVIQYYIDNQIIETVNYNQPLLPSKSTWLTYENNLTDLSIGQHEFKVMVSLITDDETLNENNESSIKFNVVSEKPEESIVVEGTTGTWCGWCPATAVALDALVQNQNNAIPIAVHNQDIMSNNDWEKAVDYFVSLHPTMLINRTQRCTPQDVLDVYENYKNEHVAPAEISAIGFPENELDDKIHLTVKCKFITNPIYKYRLNIWRVKVAVEGQGLPYEQNNYYAGGNFGPMGGFEFLSNPIESQNIIYKNVALDMLGGAWGFEGSLPDNPVQGNTYEFEYNIPNNINDFDFTENQTYVVLQRYTDNIKERTIENASILDFIVSNNNDIEKSELMRVFPNPANLAINIIFDLEKKSSVNLKLTDLLGNTILTQEEECNQGSQHILLHRNSIPAGIYLLTLTIDGISQTKKVLFN